MRLPRLITAFVALAALAASASLCTASDGHDFLNKSKSALSKVKTISYTGAFHGTGWVGPLVPKVQGEVSMGKPGKWDVPRFRAQAKVIPTGAKEEVDVTAGCNGDEYYLVDPKTKKVYVDMDAAVLGSGAGDMQRVVFNALLSDEPFGEKLDDKTVDLRETESVGGVECRKVFIDGAGVPGDPMVEWLIGTKDMIPRGIRRIYKDRKDPEKGEHGVTELLLTDLKINPPLGQKAFDPVIPAGFTKTDEFAP